VLPLTRRTLITLRAFMQPLCAGIVYKIMAGSFCHPAIKNGSGDPVKREKPFNSGNRVATAKSTRGEACTLSKLARRMKGGMARRSQWLEHRRRDSSLAS
jgi:hypothetical protein